MTHPIFLETDDASGFEDLLAGSAAKKRKGSKEVRRKGGEDLEQRYAQAVRILKETGRMKDLSRLNDEAFLNRILAEAGKREGKPKKKS